MKAPTRRRRRLVVNRARSPDDVQSLAYKAAVAELAAIDITWTDADSERLRHAIGRVHDEDTTSAGAHLDAVAIALRDEKMQTALAGAIAFSDELELDDAAETRGDSLMLAHLGPLLRRLRQLAQRATGPMVGPSQWREVLAEYAALEIGWWSNEPLTPRRLALLSILAGIPNWKGIESHSPDQLALSGRDAIGMEQKAMRHHSTRALDLQLSSMSESRRLRFRIIWGGSRSDRKTAARKLARSFS